MDKKSLRKLVSDRITALSQAERQKKDADIFARVQSFQKFTDSKTVMAYMPLADEIGLTPLLQEILQSGRQLALPRVISAEEMKVYYINNMESDLHSGAMNIMEPNDGLQEASPEKIDLVILPGRAFSPGGKRLGRGGGFYDRFLKSCPAFKLALCYEEQLYEDLPAESHDLPADAIITDRQTIMP